MSQTQEVTSLQLKGEIKVVSVVWGDKMHRNQMHSLFIFRNPGEKDPSRGKLLQ